MLTREEHLIDKLRKVEALFAGAASDGERDAAAYAIEKIRERLRRMEAVDPPVEFKFSMNNAWSRKLFVALMRRYGIKPYWADWLGSRLPFFPRGVYLEHIPNDGSSNWRYLFEQAQKGAMHSNQAPF